MYTLGQLGVAMDFDGSRLEKRMNDLAAGMEAGFPRALEQTGQLVARTIDLNIRSARNMPPLSPKTVRDRETQQRRGKPRPVAGNTAQLRNQDKLRKAATATRSGVPGSAYKVTTNDVTVGVDTSEDTPLDYALTATGLNAFAKRLKIPVRNPAVLGSEDPRQIKDYFATDVRTLIRKGL